MQRSLDANRTKNVAMQRNFKAKGYNVVLDALVLGSVLSALLETLHAIFLVETYQELRSAVCKRPSGVLYSILQRRHLVVRQQEQLLNLTIFLRQKKC